MGKRVKGIGREGAKGVQYAMDNSPTALEKYITEELSYHYADLSTNALSGILVLVYQFRR